MLGSGKFRYLVLATVSATALMITIERGPLAADITPVEEDKWWFAVEGQYLLYDGDSAEYDIEGKDGDSFDLKPTDGWGIGGEIGFQEAGSVWSYLARVRYGRSNKDSSSFYFYASSPIYTSGSAAADHREEHFIADLEIGRDVGLGALGDGSNVRLFAGLRFARFKGKGSYFSSFYSSASPGSGSDVNMKRTFIGIGPRIGFDAIVPLAEEFSFDLGAAGALLFGKQKFKASGNYYFYGTYDIDDKRSKFVVVPNLEASAALSWLVTDDAKFSLGYRVDSYFGVYDNGAMFGDSDSGDRIIHGPFIKLTINTGGGG